MANPGPRTIAPSGGPPLPEAGRPGAALVSRRHRLDWPASAPDGAGMLVPKLVRVTAQERLCSLLSACDEILALGDQDAILRRVVGLARDHIGLGRAAIFLLDRSRDLMLGTWGTDLRGAIVDEHGIMFGVRDTDREAFRRAREEGIPFTVFDDHPIVEYRHGQAAIAGVGWVACTPIRSPRAPIGMLFNDAGASDGPVDETKQVHAAILCTLLGTILDPVRSVPGLRSAEPGESPGRRLATVAIEALGRNPRIGGKELAGRLAISLGRLTRLFKSEMGMSLVEYRNRLRLDRFDLLLDQGVTSLLDAALEAGFGSYAQFHRVFRAHRRLTPREYLQRRV